MAGAQQLSTADLLVRAAAGLREGLLDDVPEELMVPASVQCAVYIAERRRGWQDLLFRLGSSNKSAPDRSGCEAMAELQRALPTTMAPEHRARVDELVARYVRHLARLHVAAKHSRGVADRLPWIADDGWDGDLVTVVCIALDPSSAVKREAT